MQYRFTQMAANVMHYSKEVAAELNHSYIGTEHILIGLLREKEGLACQVLEDHDVTEEKVLHMVSQLIQGSQTMVAEPEEYTPRSRRILEIDPASSFGTGSHDTTQLCMMALEDAVKPGDKLLDMGTGSGILAIAAAMLGADVQTIVDIDENCLKTAHENAEKNHVEIGRGLCGDALRDPKLAEDIGGGYDVIVANIVADVIIGMSPMFADKLVKGGTLICSGILNERAEEVRAALEKSGFTILSHEKSDDWSAFAAKK